MYKNFLTNEASKHKNLTDYEQRKHHKKAIKGNLKSRDELILSNLRLVVKVASYFENRGIDMDDLVSEGYNGLIKAVDKFNPKLDTKFSTYAYFWIKQAITQSIKDNKWNSRSEFNTGVTNIDNYLIDNNEDNTLVSTNVSELLNTLSLREKKIIEYYFGINKQKLNITDLAQKFNITPVRVSYIIESVLKKLRYQIMLKN